jgi:hypothetical protein
MKWQPIETAPKDGTEVLIFQRIKDQGEKDLLHLAVASWEGSYWDDRIDMPPWPKPTHWMPLPDPPND